jgi:hypothetical protein
MHSRACSCDLLKKHEYPALGAVASRFGFVEHKHHTDHTPSGDKVDW